MRIRRAGTADAMAVADVHVRSWQAAYRGAVPQEYLDGLDPERRAPVWERRLAEMSPPAAGVLVAETGGQVVGFAAFGPTRDAEDDPAAVAEIMTIYLVPGAWGRGIGRTLLAAAVRGLRDGGHREATLWVLDANARARRFYEAAGWRVDGAIKRDTIAGAPITMVRYRLTLAPDRR